MDDEGNVSAGGAVSAGWMGSPAQGGSVEGARLALVPKETGPERWARLAAMVEGGTTKAEVARAEGVSRAAVPHGLRKLGAGNHG